MLARHRRAPMRRPVRRHTRRGAPRPAARAAGRYDGDGARRAPRGARRARTSHVGAVVSLPRRRLLRPLHARDRGRTSCSKPEFFTAYTPVPARGVPGHAAGDLRVPDDDLRAHRAWTSPTPRCTTAPRRSAEAALMAARGDEAPRVSSSPRRCTRSGATTLRTYASAGTLEVATAPVGGRRRRRRGARRGCSDDAAARDRGRPELPRDARGPGGARPASRTTRARCSSSPSNPMLLGVLEPPSDYGADIVVGEGQPLGNPMSLRRSGLRASSRAGRSTCGSMPGRIVGRTVDVDGRAGVRADDADPRAAHPPREGDEQHLLATTLSTRSPRASTWRRSGAEGLAERRPGVRRRRRTTCTTRSSRPAGSRRRSGRAVRPRVRAALRRRRRRDAGGDAASAGSSPGSSLAVLSPGVVTGPRAVRGHGEAHPCGDGPLRRGGGVAVSDGRPRTPGAPRPARPAHSDLRDSARPSRAASSRRRSTCPTCDLDVALGGRARRAPPRLPHVTEVEIARHYAQLAAELRRRHRLLPARQLHDEVQPAGERGRRAGCRASPACIPYQPVGTVQGIARAACTACRRRWPRSPGLPRVTLQPAAGAHGELTGAACASARTTRPTATRASASHPRLRARHEPGDGGDVRLRGHARFRATTEAASTSTRCGPRSTPTSPRSCSRTRTRSACSTRTSSRSRRWCTRRARWRTATARTSTRSWARRARATWASTPCTSTCTRRSPRRTAAADPAPAPSRVRERARAVPARPARARGAMMAASSFARPERSIGRVRSFFGNVGVLVRAYAYIRALGGDGLSEVAEQAVLSANYLKERLKGACDLPYDRTCMHEFVLSGGAHEARARRAHARRREAAARLRLPPADGLLPAASSKRRS